LKKLKNIGQFYENSTPFERGVYTEERVLHLLIQGKLRDPRFARVLSILKPDQLSRCDQFGADVILILQNQPVWIPIQIKNSTYYAEVFKEKGEAIQAFVLVFVATMEESDEEILTNFYAMLEENFGKNFMSLVHE